MNEEQLGSLCLEWLRVFGWIIPYGSGIAPDGRLKSISICNNIKTQNPAGPPSC